MISFNELRLLGHVGRVEQARTKSGKDYTKFSVATEQPKRKQNGEWESVVTWHQVFAFDNKAAKKIEKGDRVYVVGKQINREYEKDGERRFASEVVAHIVIRESKRAGAATGDDNSALADDDDLPF